MTSIPSCGHPSSLEVKSVESAYRACELCEARTAQRDAEAMELRYRIQRDELLAALVDLCDQIRSGGQPPDTLAARAAIAKARNGGGK